MVNPAVTVSSEGTRIATKFALTLAVTMLTLCAILMFGWYGSATTQKRTICQRDAIKLLDAGRCIGCEWNAVVTFPHTGTSRTGDRVVTVECSTASELLMGSVNRTCSNNGWGPIAGVCLRRGCPQRPFALPGLPKLALSRLESNECMAHTVQSSPECSVIMQNSLMIEPVRTGTSSQVACPAPGFAGNLTATCGDGGQWIEIRDNCKRATCPDMWVSVKATTHSGAANTNFQLHLPRQQRMDTQSGGFELTQRINPWEVVPCCSDFSNTGSCIDKRGAFGFVRATCDESGLRHISNVSVINDAQGLGCLSSSAVRSRLDVDVVAAEKTYRAFVENTYDSVVAATDGKWTLPSTGVMSGVSMAVDLSDWPAGFSPVLSGAGRSLDSGMPVLTDQQRNNLSEPLPFTSRLQLARGRSAAAFAQVFHTLALSQ